MLPKTPSTIRNGSNDAVDSGVKLSPAPIPPVGMLSPGWTRSTTSGVEMGVHVAASTASRGSMVPSAWRCTPPHPVIPKRCASGTSAPSSAWDSTPVDIPPTQPIAEIATRPGSSGASYSDLPTGRDASVQLVH